MAYAMPETGLLMQLKRAPLEDKAIIIFEHQAEQIKLLVKNGRRIEFFCNCSRPDCGRATQH